MSSKALLGKIKESCVPCRRRKTRCDGHEPCSNCTLRRTERECVYNNNNAGPSAQRRSASPLLTRGPRDHHDCPPSFLPPSSASLPPSSSATSAASLTMARIIELRDGFNRLEEHVRGWLSEPERGSGSVTRDERQSGAESTRVDRDNWRKLQGVLPSRETCEVLLEYYIQECDWISSTEPVIDMWSSAISRQACSKVIAGTLCIHLALSALLLGGSTPYHRPAVDCTELHRSMYGLAKGFVVVEDDSLESLELLLSLVFYAAYSGQSGQITAAWTDLSVHVGKRGGWLDEEAGRAWQILDGKEKERARRAVGYLLCTGRWQMLFAGPDPIADVRVNLNRPADTPDTSLRCPISLPPFHLPLPFETSSPSPRHNLPFRVLRLKSDEEVRRTASFYRVRFDMRDIFALVRDYLHRLHRDPSTDRQNVIDHCADVNRQIDEWKHTILPSAGFPLPQMDSVDFSDPLACRTVAQSLLLHDIIGRMAAQILRHWLDVDHDDGLAPISASLAETLALTLTRPTLQTLQVACLDNAARVVSTIPTVKALLHSRMGPFLVTMSAANLFNAATTFAIPLLRAVRQLAGASEQTSRDEVLRLPVWPEDVYPQPPDRTGPGRMGRLPSVIYNDESIRGYAVNILLILDALSHFRASPLGEAAEKRLESLITQYGLKDSQGGVQYERPLSPSFLESADASIEVGTSVNVTPVDNPPPSQHLDPRNAPQLFEESPHKDEWSKIPFPPFDDYVFKDHPFQT